MRKLLGFLLILPVGVSIHLSAQDLVLEEVVVTATKKEENVQDIAQTVNALTDSAITDYQIRGFSEISQLVSGVEFSPIDPRRGTITIRGQVLDPDTGAPQPIQVYVDENPVRPIVAFYDMFDMERVEVLKGTQGTLQGVVSSGGAIHMYTKDPEIGADSNNAYVRTSFADNNMQVFEFGTDFQLSDTMAMRIAGVSNNNDGNEVHNIRTQVDENHEYDAYRLTLKWEPSDELSMKFKYQNMEMSSISPRPLAGSNGPFTYDAFADITGASNPFFPAATLNSYAQAVGFYLQTLGALQPAAVAQLGFMRRPNYSDLPAVLYPEDATAIHFVDPLQQNSGHLMNFHVDYDLGSHLVSLRLSDYQNDILGLIDRDYAGAFLHGSPQEVRTNSGIKTTEFRISSLDNEQMEYTIGFFTRDSQTFTHADLDVSQAVYQAAPFATVPIVPFNYETPFDACLAADADPAVFANLPYIVSCVGIPVDSETTAYFANFKYNLSDQTFVQVGFREQEVDGFRQQQTYIPVSTSFTQAMGGGGTFEGIPLNLQNPSSDASTGSFKIGHYIEEDVLLYITFETGYREPGSAISPTRMNPVLLTFDEEETSMTEFGMKGTFLDGRLKLNLAYFDYAFDGFQQRWSNPTVRSLTPFGAPDVIVEAAGGLFTNNDASLSGFDIEYQYVVSDSIVLGGGITTNESEYDTGALGYTVDPTYSGLLAATKDITGTPLNDAAELTWTFFLDHTVPSFAGGERYTRYNVNYRDNRSSSLNESLKIDEMYLANFYLGWRSADEQWDANIFVKNVLDQQELAFIAGNYNLYNILGGNAIGSGFYEGVTNRGRQVGLSLTYNF
jgi:outer membrane receptor protein involved in Fe transport